MDRRDMARRFRSRLGEAMARSGLNRSTLARRTGIDRSTLSQLLSGDTGRLPRSDTVAAIATALGVSLDWLLGLSREDRLSADILLESVQFTPSAGAVDDEGLDRWYQEAAGYKIRHVPTTLPDPLKTDRVIRHEFRDSVARTADQAIGDGRHRLAYIRQPETDVEICMTVQGMASFARGEGVWRGLPPAARLEQVERMIALGEELYPSLRLFFYDELSHYSVPYTIFGPLRAALYVGQMYFVFNSTEHIRVLAQHFDGLIRAAVVQANEAAGFLRTLGDDIGNG